MRAPALSTKRPGGSLADLRAALVPSARLRRRALVTALVAAAIAALYAFWFRDSSFVAVERVAVTGVTTRDGERLRAALESTARGMTTLHVDRQRLERTAAVFPIVERIEVTTDFPHGMTVHVVEHRAVALLEAGGRTVPVAGDGTVLTGMPAGGDLPTIESSGAVTGRALAPGAALDAAIVAGGAPPALTPRIESIGREGGARGVVAELENGPEIVFGDADRAAAKWAAVARVLADDDASGATYLDVRIPERPVAGGLPVETVTPIAPIGETSAEPVIPPSDPTATEPATPAVDPNAAAPVTAVPDPVTPVTPTAPEATGGLTP